MAEGWVGPRTTHQNSEPTPCGRASDTGENHHRMRRRAQANLRVTGGTARRVRVAAGRNRITIQTASSPVHHGAVPGASLRQHSFWSGSWVGPTSMNDEPCWLAPAVRLQQPHHHHRYRRHIPDRFSASAKSPLPRSDGWAHSAHSRTSTALKRIVLYLHSINKQNSKLLL